MHTKTKLPALPRAARLVLYPLLVTLVAGTLIFLYDQHATLQPLIVIRNLTLERYPPRHETCVYQSPVFQDKLAALARHPPTLALAQEHHGVFRRPHDGLQGLSWKDCLPMHTLECGVLAGDETSLFSRPAADRKCRASILHHILTAATSVMERRGFVAVPVGPTLRHIWEYAALPPGATAIEVATDAHVDVADAFWAQGLAHFSDPHHGTVTCMAPHHPLASLLYAPELPVVVGPDTGIPYLHWSMLSPAKTALGFEDATRFVVDGAAGRIFARQQLFPVSCLSLFNASIPAPRHPAVFFGDVAAPANGHDEAPTWTYPNPRCEAYCDRDSPRVAVAPTPNAPHCHLHDDVVFNARLATYVHEKHALHLSANQSAALEIGDDVEKRRAGKGWQYCLPIQPLQCGVGRGDKSTLFETKAGKPCRSAVLQLLLEAMLEVANEENLAAFVYFGTLLGAWRDSAIIPHTRDIDIVMPSDTDWVLMQDKMWARGFYVFNRGIYGACVAAHHPLAPLLYAPESSLTDGYDHGTPYLDLYMWYHGENNTIPIDTAMDALPAESIFPLTCKHKIFANQVPGIQYPESMFHSEYGASYVKDTKFQLNACQAYCDH
ncbi:hypothetical protein ACHHYP_16312 [Achlya hypogyna]|uniref:Uncharacterized protein n=1 Tax=Achlya hypogyna TaxID=1202772 RepID=A0A1V9Y955_ACHHY|nr:hypothetical protein ACHHYP_16312 [Achlya hypogyna]